MDRVKLDIGAKYGHLTVVENLKIRSGFSKVRCICECGKEWKGLPIKITSGHTKSCGCRKGKHIHSMSHSCLYKVWQGIKDRCENPNNKAYRNYGKRGISIYEQWYDPEKFIKWALESGYQKGLQIDRIDNNSNYSPSNCRWVTPLQNSQNKRTNKNITIKGETKTMAAWARNAGMTFTGFRHRVMRGVTGEALLAPSKKRGNNE